MRSKIKYVALFVLLFALTGWLFVLRHASPTIPNADDITCMTVTMTTVAPAIPEFEVPQSNYQDVLTLFRDAEADWSPAKWGCYGRVKIETNNETFNYSLFLTSETTGAFRSSPYNYYRGTSDDAIISTITDARESAEKLNKEADRTVIRLN